jgi:hypothetical protein
MSKKPTKPKAQKTAPKLSRVIVLFGLDEEGKPRAARFPDDDPALISKAAQALGLRVGIATKGPHFETVQKLPIGRIYATGNGSVPKVAQELYDQVIALAGGEIGPISPTLPKSWAELAPGHVVLAQDTIEDGWFEAVVIKRDGDTLTVKWRDYPSVPEFERPVTAIALLNSNQT